MTDQETLDAITHSPDCVEEPRVFHLTLVHLLLEEAFSSVLIGKRVRVVHNYSEGLRVICQGTYLVVEDL